MQKNASINYGGTWVFPGGRVDYQDRELLAEDSSNRLNLDLGRITATREMREETGLIVRADELEPFSRWLTPALRDKRYDTLFYLLDADSLMGEVKIDQGEIVDSRWLSPADALSQQESGQMQLNPPSFVSLKWLQTHGDVTSAITACRQLDLMEFEPKIVLCEDGFISLYCGDFAYDDANITLELAESGNGPRHRTYVYKTDSWQYIREI